MSRLLYLTVSLLAFFSCTKKTHYPTYDDPVPQHKVMTLYSQSTNEDRVINIWTPKEYDAENGEALPVLYMPDGGIKEDFPHIANTLAELIESKKIPPYILVGIENTERGRDLTGASTVKKHEKYGIPMTDGAKNFRAFLIDELRPEIEKNYRTTGYNGLMGESLAGLFTTETFMMTPNAFDVYIAFDPSLWWNDNYLVSNAETFLADLPDRQTKIWFAASSAKGMAKKTKQLAAHFEKSNYPNLTWSYSYEPDEEHHTIFRATKRKALIWALSN